jgi:hypothetical protein
MMTRSRSNSRDHTEALAAPELAGRIDVENKKSVVIEMSRDLAKHFPPFSEGEEVIDGIEHADNRIKTFRNAKGRHALPVKAHVRQFLAREREHLPGPIETRNFIGAGKKTRDGAGAASDFKDGFCLRLVTLDETTGKIRSLRPFAHDEIVESRKFFIGHNSG